MSLDEQGFLSPDIAQHRDNFRSTYAKHFEVVENAIKCCHSTKYTLNVHNRDGQEVFAAGLLLKLMADVEATVLLLERGMASSARSLLRVALECSVNLANICESPEFLKTFILIAERERLRLIKGIRQSHSPDFDEFKKTIADDLVKEIQERLEGQQDPNTRELFKNVGMDEMYNTQYRLYSADTHSNPPSVEPMFDYDERNQIKGFKWGPAADQDLRPELIECARLLITALRMIRKIFMIDIDAQLSILLREYQRIVDQLP